VNYAVITLTTLLLCLVANAAAAYPIRDHTTYPEHSADRSVTLPLSTVADTILAENSWPMAGANPERTSWTPEEIKGSLNPIWYKPFEPYISQRIQIIAADGILYVATANGLYALDANTGAERWVYPTELPLGHSPTIHNGVAYVGGFDHKLHAVNASTGEGLWTFSAGAGFQTNPLVVSGIVYAGNRDGAFYAVHAEGANAGQLAWKFETGGPVLYSAAYKDGVIFFASNDSHAYALNALTGQLVWKSEKLPGAGFASWWPVVYQNRVIFSGSNNYRLSSGPGPGALAKVELEDIYPNREQEPTGTLVGALGQAPGGWAPGTITVDASRILSYFAEKPWRRTVFVLDRFTGAERETAPLLWTGNDGSVTRYPPVVGGDGVLYQQNNYLSDPAIPGGQISGWQPGNPHISIVTSDWGAIDEPHAASAGGNLVYWNLCCDRQAGAMDVTVPNTVFADRYAQGIRPPTGPAGPNREWRYFTYDLLERIPGYNVRYYNPQDNYVSPYANFDGPNGVYGFHSDVNAPIPYQGKIYMHRSNAIIAFGNTTAPVVPLPTVVRRSAEAATIPDLDVDLLKMRLEQEVQKILNAGHLRPGYVSHGHFDLRGQFQCGDDLVDYWHQPAETIYTLLLALPLLPADMQPSVRAYLNSEFAAYPPYEFNHVGWRDGASREIFDIPPEVAADFANYPSQPNAHGFAWKVNPFSFYVLWKYAEVFGNANMIFQAGKNKLDPVPPDAVLLQTPHIHNAFIAGYLGYVELAKLAGQPVSNAITSELSRLLQLRTTHFTKDSAYGNVATIPGVYCRTLSVSSNFMFMVPELAQHLRENALSKVQSAVDEYTRIAPYWFVTLASEGYAENPRTVLYDSQGLFMAKALILDESGEQLAKYLDVPAFPTGDVYYVQKLITAIHSQPTFTLDVSPVIRVEAGGSATAVISVQSIGGFDSLVTLDVTSTSPALIAGLSQDSLIPPGEVILTLNDTHTNLSSGLWGSVRITAAGGDSTQITNVSVLVGGTQSHLPAVNCQICLLRARDCFLRPCKR
jgi:outer membrane protein assembly factor BamB